MATFCGRSQRSGHGHRIDFALPAKFLDDFALFFVRHEILGRRSRRSDQSLHYAAPGEKFFSLFRWYQGKCSSRPFSNRFWFFKALRNNLADVSAKDGSQETCVNLIASLIGVFMLSFLDARWRFFTRWFRAEKVEFLWKMDQIFF